MNVNIFIIIILLIIYYFNLMYCTCIQTLATYTISKPALFLLRSNLGWSSSWGAQLACMLDILYLQVIKNTYKDMLSSFDSFFFQPTFMVKLLLDKVLAGCYFL